MPNDKPNYIYSPSPDELQAIRTTAGLTSVGKRFDWYVKQKMESGDWRLECIRPDVLGLPRPLEVFRAVRKTNLVKPWPRSDDAESYCPAHWADLAIGRGACGLRCRGCFLILTHRVKCDPSRHVLYENIEDFERATRKYLLHPSRNSVGLGIDCSDSLLYEGVTGHARRLIPVFASPETNPHGLKFILLTKSINVRYLRGLPTRNIIVTFSLNPEPIADLWEGKFNDGVRVTPTVEKRLQASLEAEEMGFEVRWRVDPILTVDAWEDIYSEFFNSAARNGHKPTRITLGTYRETQPSLHTFARCWGLPRIEWQPCGLEKDGAHYHVPKQERIRIYAVLAELIKGAWRGTGHEPVTALCKEPRGVRKDVGLNHDMCNCG